MAKKQLVIPKGRTGKRRAALSADISDVPRAKAKAAMKLERIKGDSVKGEDEKVARSKDRTPVSQRPTKRPSQKPSKSKESKKPKRRAKELRLPVPELVETGQVVMTTIRISEVQHTGLGVAAVMRQPGKRPNRSALLRDLLQAWRDQKFVISDDNFKPADKLVVTSMEMTAIDHQALHLEAVRRFPGKRADASAVLRAVVDASGILEAHPLG